MFFLVVLLSIQNCFAVKHIVLDGPFISYRDIDVSQRAHYTIDVPRGKDTVFSENWFDLHENQKNEEKKEQVFFLSNESKQRYVCKNALITCRNNGKTLCDGMQVTPDAQYMWLKVWYNPESKNTLIHIFKQSMNEMNWDWFDKKSTEISHHVLLRNAEIAACAFKFPCIAWIKKNNWLSVTHLDENITTNGMSLPFALRKLSWLKGKNLLGLTASGDIVTIKAQDKFQVYKQHFKGKSFIDIAVDMDNPWRFVALATDLSIIYVDFSTYKKYKVGEKKVSQAPFKLRKTYTVLMKLDTWPEPRSYKIWFNNNKIGVYENTYTENGNYRTLTICELKSKSFILDMNEAKENILVKNCILNSTEFFNSLS
jgi:hypothetical protein